MGASLAGSAEGVGCSASALPTPTSTARTCPGAEVRRGGRREFLTLLTQVPWDLGNVTWCHTRCRDVLFALLFPHGPRGQPGGHAGVAQEVAGPGIRRTSEQQARTQS